MITNQDISKAMQVKLEDIFAELPEYPAFEKGIRRAPKRNLTLNQSEVELALKNALRYIPEKWQATLAPEILEELLTMGTIYVYRFRPVGNIKAKGVE